MFEAQLAFYLNKYLGSYLHGLDAESLKVITAPCFTPDSCSCACACVCVCAYARVRTCVRVCARVFVRLCQCSCSCNTLQLYTTDVHYRRTLQLYTHTHVPPPLDTWAGLCFEHVLLLFALDLFNELVDRQMRTLNAL